MGWIKNNVTIAPNHVGFDNERAKTRWKMNQVDALLAPNTGVGNLCEKHGTLKPFWIKPQGNISRIQALGIEIMNINPVHEQNTNSSVSLHFYKRTSS
jgi:hypothetical protein